MDDIEKGYTKKKYRRKIPKVVRWYNRHRDEDKTFDKSEDTMSELEKGRGPDKAPRKKKDQTSSSREDRMRAAKNSLGYKTPKVEATPEAAAKDTKSKKDKREAALKRIKAGYTKQAQDNLKMNKSQENTMAKSIEQEIEDLAKSMEDSTMSPQEQVMRTIEELGPEGLKKAMPELSTEQKVMLKTVLEDVKKSMEFDQVTPKKDMTKLAESGAELEEGSDDEDEKIAAQAESTISHQGDNSPEGIEGQIIKGEDMKDKMQDKKIADKEAKEEVKDHEKKMHGKKDMKKMCKSDLIALKDAIIKSYEDAGLAYTDDLIKSQMKDSLLKTREAGETKLGDGMDAAKLPEMSQVKAATQMDGKEDTKSSKEVVKDIEEAKLAETTADAAVAKAPALNKSIKFDKDENSILKACTGGRNMHYSVNAHYDEALDALAKSKEEPKEEELKKSESEFDTNDIIEKGMDRDADFVKTDILLAEHKANGHVSETFSNVDLLDAMGMSEEEAKKILGE